MDYGIEYKANEGGRGNVYYNGEIIKIFADENDKAVFTYESEDKGTVIVRTVYDNNGNLIGLTKE